MLLRNERVRREMADRINIGRLAAQGDYKSTQKALKELGR